VPFFPNLPRLVGTSFAFAFVVTSPHVTPDPPCSHPLSAPNIPSLSGSTPVGFIFRRDTLVLPSGGPGCLRSPCLKVLTDYLENCRYPPPCKLLAIPPLAFLRLHWNPLWPLLILTGDLFFFFRRCIDQEFEFCPLLFLCPLGSFLHEVLRLIVFPPLRFTPPGLSSPPTQGSFFFLCPTCFYKLFSVLPHKLPFWLLSLHWRAELRVPPSLSRLQSSKFTFPLP